MDTKSRLFISKTVTAVLMVCALTAVALPCQGRSLDRVEISAKTDSIQGIMPRDTAYESVNDSLKKIVVAIDSANNDSVYTAYAKPEKKKKAKRDWASWRPNTKRALWLALVIPGAGQIYNRKYWKLPIVYGGFLGCLYAIRWNNQMYNDYSQAYMDLMDNDPNTQSYNEFLHLGATITDDNAERYQETFRKRKDYYRRYRDLSVFILIGVYALSVIDAYVDASLSEFDISKDLSLRVQPAVINNGTSNNPLKSSSLGLQCYITF